MVFGNGVRNIQAADYNSARTVVSFKFLILTGKFAVSIKKNSSKHSVFGTKGTLCRILILTGNIPFRFKIIIQTSFFQS
jgi:hypothetical protein